MEPWRKVADHAQGSRERGKHSPDCRCEQCRDRGRDKPKSIAVLKHATRFYSPVMAQWYAEQGWTVRECDDYFLAVPPKAARAASAAMLPVNVIPETGANLAGFMSDRMPKVRDLNSAERLSD
jgi:hypothetical protein